MAYFNKMNVSIFVDLKSGLVKFDSSVANSVSSKVYRIGRNELYLLVILFESIDIPLARVELIDKCWGNKFVTDNTLSVSVSKLRKLLSSIGCHDDLKTINCYGYMLTPEVGNYQIVTNEKVQQLVISRFG